MLDLWSKGAYEYPAIGAAPLEQSVWIDGWLRMRTTWNPGGVWSLDVPGGLLTWATGLAIPLVAFWIVQPARAPRAESAAKACILGGAIGNFYDRYRWNAVRDFIEVSFGSFDGWHWPTFNIADVGLVAGILLLFLLSFKKPEPAAAEGGAGA